MPLTFKPLTTRTWEDLQTLFGENGACGGCWCMYWRCTHKEYEKNKGTINKANLQKLVTDGLPLGVLVFDGDRPAGWCSISPRESLVRLQNSRLFKPIDEEPVWSISCLYVKKNYRRKGLSQQLIRAAADYAFEEGATTIEAYPVIPKNDNIPAAFSWVGFANSYKEAGFKTITQPSESRLLMRLKK